MKINIVFNNVLTEQYTLIKTRMAGAKKLNRLYLERTVKTAYYIGVGTGSSESDRTGSLI